MDPISSQTHEPFSKSQVDWATDASVKVKSLPKVCGWQLMIRPIKLDEKTKSGIYLPQKTLGDIESFTNVGEVVAMGPLCYQDTRLGEAPWCQVGDLVVFHRHAGTRFRWQGVKMTLVPDDKVMLVIKNVADFDQTEDMAEFD